MTLVTAAYIPCTEKLLLELLHGPWKGLQRVEKALLQFKVKLNPLHSFDAIILILQLCEVRSGRSLKV